MSRSILSTGERAVAEGLRDGLDAEEIARQRDEPVEAVENSVRRVREKTDRALATLAESPFLSEAAADLDDSTRERLLEALRE